MNSTTWRHSLGKADIFEESECIKMGNIYDKKNAEGYSDPTPYQAIRNMIKPGEVWTFRKKDDAEAEVLVVAFNDNVATILFLMDEYKEGCIEVVSTDVKWVNPRMLNWSWGGYLCKCVRKLSVQEFDQVLAEIEKILSVQVVKEADAMANPVPDPVRSAEIVAMKQELDAMCIRVKEADAVAHKYEASFAEAKAEAEKNKIQLDLMKSMYAELMEKFLQRA